MSRKPHVTRKGVVLREVPVPVSPSAKKRKAEDMANHILNKQKKKLPKLVINVESTEEEVVKGPPVANSPKKSTVKMIVVSSHVSTPKPIIVSLPLV